MPLRRLLPVASVANVKHSENYLNGQTVRSFGLPPDIIRWWTRGAAELPAQGQQTYRAILHGGPFRHDKDGSVFGNRERLLPRERRGHYREYTVETPGERDRGARRIVCGGERKVPQACWYTADHYASFRRIVP